MRNPLHRDAISGAFFHRNIVAQRHESVGETGRDVQLPRILIRQLGAHPFAERRRSDADVDRNVEDPSLKSTNELGLVMRMLEMQTTQHSAA